MAIFVLIPTLGHFHRAALEIGARGDNDTLPFNVNVRFVQDKADKLAILAIVHIRAIAGQGESTPLDAP